MAHSEVETVRPAKRSINLVQVVGILAFVAGLVVYVELRGLPRQGFQVVIILWLATVAWDVRRPVRDHLAFLRDWWPPFAVLVAYLYSRGISDDLGLFDVHVTEPIEADRWLFGGTLPTEYLQAKLCGVPCSQSMPPAWYDVVLTTVYYSHFFAALGIGLLLWVADRAGWIHFMRRYLSIVSLSVICYILYPMAPPWMAARDGHLSDDIARITGRGWFDLTASANSTETAQQNISAIGNQVAAMPSLHSALAIFIAWWVVARYAHPWRWAVLLYPASMLLALVYYAEHYVVDEIAGALLVAVVLAGWGWWDRRSQASAGGGAVGSRVSDEEETWAEGPTGCGAAASPTSPNG